MLNHDGSHSTAACRDADGFFALHLGETNERSFGHHIESRFLHAWRQAIAIVGIRYFGNGRADNLVKASSKWDLVPRLAAIRFGAGQLERNEQIFLSTLLSLYNPREAARLRKECGLSNFPDLTLLDPVWGELLSELFLTSTGW